MLYAIGNGNGFETVTIVTWELEVQNRMKKVVCQSLIQITAYWAYSGEERDQVTIITKKLEVQNWQSKNIEFNNMQ